MLAPGLGNFISDLGLHLLFLLRSKIFFAKLLLQILLNEAKSAYCRLGCLFLILNNSKKIEPDFTLWILFHTLLHLFPCFGEPIILSASTKWNRSFLKTIQLIELPIVRDISNEMEHIIILFGRSIFIFYCERILSSETIVYFSNQFRVADGPSFILRIHAHREILYLG